MNSINSVLQNVNSGSFTLTTSTSSPTVPFGTARGTVSDISSVNSTIMVLATPENALQVMGDVKIAGKIKCDSLEERLAEIEARIGILQCRHDLEDRVSELKDIGDQYRTLVKKLEQKLKIADILVGE